jgi:CRISPR-associated endonuclease Csn1
LGDLIPFLLITNLKGNINACEIRDVIGNSWDDYSNKDQIQLFEDLFTIKKKSSLKARLITHWDFYKQSAVNLCLIEFDPSNSNHSLKAIKALLTSRLNKYSPKVLALLSSIA